jgi:hypothetical protein
MKKLDAIELVDFKQLLSGGNEGGPLTKQTPFKYYRYKYVENDDRNIEGNQWLYSAFVDYKNNDIVEYHYYHFLKNVLRDIDIRKNGLGEL